MRPYDQALDILSRRFGKNSPISVATVSEGLPQVRTVDGYYEQGAFYVVTYALSGKMRQIEREPRVALCGEWFTAHGIGENLGHVKLPQNAHMMEKLREAFSSWYQNGHVDESDPNTCLLRIRLTDGVLMDQGTRYQIDFGAETA